MMSRNGTIVEAIQPTPDPSAAGDSKPSAASAALPNAPFPGGSRELLALAAPLIVSQSFMTVQVFVDTILLSRHDPREMAASLPGGDVVLAAVRPAPGHRRLHLHLRRPVHRGRPAAPRRAGRLAGHPLRRPRRPAVPARRAGSRRS